MVVVCIGTQDVLRSCVVLFLEAVEGKTYKIGVPKQTSRVNLEVKKFNSVQMGVDDKAVGSPGIAVEPSAGKQSAESKELCAPMAEIIKLSKEIGEVSKGEEVPVAINEQEDASEGSEEPMKTVARRASKGAGAKKPQVKPVRAKVMPSRPSRSRATKTPTLDAIDVQDGGDEQAVVEEPVVDAKWKPPRSKVPLVDEDKVKIAVADEPATTAGRRKRKVEVIFEAGMEYRMVSPTDVKETVGTGYVILPEPGESGIFHGKPVPKACVVVQVTSVAVPGALLPHPNMGDDPPATVLGDAIGTTVAWPVKCVKSEEISKKR